MAKQKRSPDLALDVLRCPRCVGKTLVVAAEITDEEEALEVEHPGRVVHYVCLSCRCRVPICQRCNEYHPDVFYGQKPCRECGAHCRPSTNKKAKNGEGDYVPDI